VTQTEINQTEPAAERSPRRAPARAYWLIAKSENGQIGMLTLHRGVEKILPVFSHKEEAEIFLGLGGIADDDWQVRESSTMELISVLHGTCADVNKVALDPLPEMLSESTVGLVSLSRERFIEYITAGRLPLGPCEDERGRRSEAGWSVVPEMIHRRKKQINGAPREEDQTVTVLLANSHRLLRRGLKELLSGDASIEVVGEAVDEGEAVALAWETKPDVVVLDDDGSGTEARKAVGRMLEISPPPGVVIAAHGRSARPARKLLKQGASAYLGIDASSENLLAAVRTAASGPREGYTFLAAPRAALMQVDQDEKSTPSSRELEILLLVARGSSNRQIACALRVAEPTVKRHLANLYFKMKVGSRAEAIRQALSEGWISVRDIVGGEERTRDMAEDKRRSTSK
jgi:DNA-binding NarL/FixJ family response regulator